MLASWTAGVWRILSVPGINREGQQWVDLTCSRRRRGIAAIAQNGRPLRRLSTAVVLSFDVWLRIAECRVTDQEPVGRGEWRAINCTLDGSWPARGRYLFGAATPPPLQSAVMTLHWEDRRRRGGGRSSPRSRMTGSVRLTWSSRCRSGRRSTPRSPRS